jgi:hypothetical protein
VFTYVNPAVAIVLGVIWLDETFTVGMAVGFPLILLGCVLASRRPGGSGPVSRSSARWRRAGRSGPAAAKTASAAPAAAGGQRDPAGG